MRVRALLAGALLAGSLPPATAAAADPCGPGFVPLRAGGRVMCAHAGGDPAPPAAGPRSRRPMEKAPRCYGNGVNGNRVQLVYVSVKGAKSRLPAMRSSFVQIVRRIEGVVRSASKAQGDEIGVRFHAPACKLRFSSLTVSKQVAAAKPDIFTQSERVMDALAAAGFDSSDRKYLVWADFPGAGDNRKGSSLTGGVCGIATGAYDTSGAPMSIWDNPTPLNPHSLPNLALYALIYRAPWSYPTRVPPGLSKDPCWAAGSTGADTETHELFHTLGAVQTTAPNSNGLGHCSDGPDVMCYVEFGKRVQVACAYVGGVKQLDCGGDDYFNVNPAPGSYLSTHWNTANSSFLSDAPLDALAIV